MEGNSTGGVSDWLKGDDWFKDPHATPGWVSVFEPLCLFLGATAPLSILILHTSATRGCYDKHLQLSTWCTRICSSIQLSNEKDDGLEDKEEGGGTVPIGWFSHCS